MKTLFKYLGFFFLYFAPSTFLASLALGKVGCFLGIAILTLLLLGVHMFSERMITSHHRPEKLHPQGLPKKLKGVRIRSFVSPRDEAFWVKTWPSSPTLWISRGWLNSRTDAEIKSVLNLLASDKPSVLTLRTWITAVLSWFLSKRTENFGFLLVEWVVGSWVLLVIALIGADRRESVWLYALEVLSDRDPMRLLLVKQAIQR